MSTTSNAVTLCCGLVAAVALAAPAAAQDALGSGHALDRNLSPQSGGLNRAVRQRNFRTGNNIVTDSVLGGRGFRGTVGYGAEGAFRSPTGSDDLYQFRRDAAWSDVNMINFGYTYQRFRFGQDAGLLEYSRVGQANSARSLAMQNTATQVYPSQSLVDAQIRVDRIAFQSQLENVARSGTEPIIIGAGQEGETPYLWRSSTFGGVRPTSIGEVGSLIGLTTYDLARISDDKRLSVLDTEPETRLGEPFRSSYGKLDPDAFAALDPINTRIDATVPSPRIGDDILDPGLGDGTGDAGDGTTGEGIGNPDDPIIGRSGEIEFRGIQESIADRYRRLGEEPVEDDLPPGVSTFLDRDELLQLEEDLFQLRRRLSGAETDETETDESDAGNDRLPDLGNPDDPGGLRKGLGDDEGNVREDLLVDPRKLPRSVAEYGLILRHGQQVDRLSSDDTDRFNELLSLAEEALREGEYFKAERRFNRALRFTPGHPLATAGLAHTQIGAGLYLSASLTLRSLFSYQPEMIDTKYSPSLVPNKPRLLDAISTLEERLANVGDRTATAFLLAYVGRLLGERVYVVRGLSAMAQDSPRDPLIPLLREVWLVEDGPAVLPEPVHADADESDSENENESKEEGEDG